MQRIFLGFAIAMLVAVGAVADQATYVFDTPGVV